MRKRMIGVIFLLTITAGAFAQADQWVGTWKASNKPWPHIPATVMELQIGQPEKSSLYPAKLTIRYGEFTGAYYVLLAKKNNGQLGIGRNKVPQYEKPFKLGIWMMYLNGTLDIKGNTLSLHRMWISNFGFWMSGLYDEDEIYVNSKVTLREMLYRDSLSFKKTGNIPWKDTMIQHILHPEGRAIYYGIYEKVISRQQQVSIDISDVEQQDRDTVTLTHNGKLIFNKAEINDENRRKEIKLDTGMNIFTFFADNYGALPPNTGNLQMTIDGKPHSFDFTRKSNAFSTFLVAQVYHAPGDTLPEQPTVPPTVTPPSPPVAQSIDTLSRKAELRKTERLGALKVPTKDITLELWDGQLEDGDSVSLRLNGKWVATGFPVKNKVQTIQVTLQPGENVLLFIADNVGSIPPNTSELRIRYAGQKKSYGLNTDLKRNNEIRIDYVPED